MLTNLTLRILQYKVLYVLLQKAYIKFLNFEVYKKTDITMYSSGISVV